MAGKPIHGMSETPMHRIWKGMKARCLNPNNPRWSSYGGRGIRVCQRWQHSFKSFYDDMGPRPAGTSLERVDNNGDYKPSNCVWATPKQQQNNMRSNVFVEHEGRRLTVTQWAREVGIGVGTVRARLRRGWTVQEMLNPDTSKQRKRRGMRLTVAQAVELKRQLSEGVSQREIAMTFGVSKATVGDIACGRTWPGAGL